MWAAKHPSVWWKVSPSTSCTASCSPDGTVGVEFIMSTLGFVSSVLVWWPCSERGAGELVSGSRSSRCESSLAHWAGRKVGSLFSTTALESHRGKQWCWAYYEAVWESLGPDGKKIQDLRIKIKMMSLTTARLKILEPHWRGRDRKLNQSSEVECEKTYKNQGQVGRRINKVRCCT